MSHTAIHEIAPELERCIDECMRCYAVCVSTAQYCLQQGGAHAEPSHVRVLLDCAEICRTSADYMLRGSDLHHETCRVCAVICTRCAEACSLMADDAIMTQCAEASRRCAESCRDMVGEA